MPIDFARGAATQVGGTILRKVAGGIGDIIKSKERSPTSPIEPTTRSKYATGKIRSFPIDIGEDPGVGNHGHYIMFFINQVKPAKLKMMKTQDGKQNLEKSKQEHNIPEQTKEIDRRRLDIKGVTFGQNRTSENETGATAAGLGTSTNLGGSAAAGIEGFHFGQKQNVTPNVHIDDNMSTKTATRAKEQARTEGNTLAIQRAPTTRLSDAIQMYMPPQVQVNYIANYTDTEIGITTQAAVDIFDTVVGDASVREKGSAVIDRVKTGSEDFLLSTALKGADTFFPGAKAAYEIGKGQIISDRLELAFQGIAKRKFQYIFKMMPRSEREAQEIKQILQLFKVNMLPEFVGGDRSGRRMIVPNTFNIHYMYLGSQNQYLDPISECVLTNMSVSYGGERFRTFDPDSSGNAPPVETQVQLEFAELELITRERVLEENEPMSFGPTNSIG